MRYLSIVVDAKTINNICIENDYRTYIIGVYTYEIYLSEFMTKFYFDLTRECIV